MAWIDLFSSFQKDAPNTLWARRTPSQDAAPSHAGQRHLFLPGESSQLISTWRSLPPPLGSGGARHKPGAIFQIVINWRQIVINGPHSYFGEVHNSVLLELGMGHALVFF